jgi:hypothetical protein
LRIRTRTCWLRSGKSASSCLIMTPTLPAGIENPRSVPAWGQCQLGQPQNSRYTPDCVAEGS